MHFPQSSNVFVNGHRLPVLKEKIYYIENEYKFDKIRKEFVPYRKCTAKNLKRTFEQSCKAKIDGYYRYSMSKI